MKPSTNLYRIRSLWFIFCLFVSYSPTFSQNCSQQLDFQFQPSENGINWYQFPKFDLPFTIVYGASREIYDPQALLERGFSHISNHNWYGNLPDDKKAFIFYNIADLPNQPWKTHKSPYGNDLKAYEAWWSERLEDIKAQNNGNLNFDIFSLDIEHYHKSKDSVIALRREKFVPENLKNLNDDDFFLQYQKDMQLLYAHVANFFKSRVNTTHFTSYGDVPIFNTFTNILGPTWDEWQTKLDLLSFMNYDYLKKNIGGEFYNALDILAPSAYFYYDYPHTFAGEYLSYLLFQIEANKVWSNKEQLVFLWNKYSYSPQYVGKNIKPWMSEAMAIFPFFSGAEGIWLWDDFSPTSSFNGYEYFMKGLYRLSKFKDFFTGEYKLVKIPSAWELNNQKLPVWRGVYKDGKLLVVAHNPWAESESQETLLQINYGTLHKQIKLKGHEVFICEFPANFVTQNEIKIQNFHIYPNPSGHLVKFQLNQSDDISASIFDMTGKKWLSKNFTTGQNLKIDGELDISNLPEGNYLVVFRNHANFVTKKLAIKR